MKLDEDDLDELVSENGIYQELAAIRKLNDCDKFEIQWYISARQEHYDDEDKAMEHECELAVKYEPCTPGTHHARHVAKRQKDV